MRSARRRSRCAPARAGAATRQATPSPQGEVRTYRVDAGARQLLRRDEATGATVPVLDNVSAMAVEYLDGGRRIRVTLRLAPATPDPRVPEFEISVRRQAAEPAAAFSSVKEAGSRKLEAGRSWKLGAGDMALLTALFATVLLMALGLAVALLGSAETTLAPHDRDARALAYAARAAATVAAVDLRALPNWDELSTPGGRAGGFRHSRPIRRLDAHPGCSVGWAALDLRALTAPPSGRNRRGAPSGGPAPAWRLFEYGPLARLVPDVGLRNPCYLVVWVAREDGLVVTRAAAYGPDDGRSIVEVTMTRPAALDPSQDSDDSARALTC